MVPKALILLLLVPTVAADLDEAVAWLQEGEPDRLRVAAVHVAGVDTFDSWYGAFPIPANDATGSASVRSLHAALASGYDPRAYPDPVRGTIDLQQQVLDNHAAILQTGRGADLAWHVLALHAAGLRGAEAVEAAHLLAALQDRGFPCNQDDIHPDCTGFAVAAISTTAVAFDREAVLDYYHLEDGAYVADGHGANTDTQAWAILAVQRAGGEVPQEAWDWLLDRQLPSGAFQATPGAPGHEATWLFPTSDAALALAGFPGPAWVEPKIVAHGDGWCVEGLNATWSWEGGAFEGPCVSTTPPGLRLHATGEGVHARVAFDAPAADTPAALWPFTLLAAAQLARVGSARLRQQTAPHS